MPTDEQQTAADVVPDDWWFPSPGHTEALARLEFVVDRGWSCANLVGPAGTGKSRLVDRCSESLRRRGLEVERLEASLLPPEALALAVVECLGSESDHQSAWQSLRDLGAEREATSARAVVVCDHVESEVAYAMVERLRRHVGPAITIVAVGRALPAGELRIELGPWTPAECVSLLAAWAELAGHSLDATVRRTLAERCGGHPGRLRRMAELAVVAGCTHECGVTPRVVHGVAAEFHTATTY